MSPDLQGEYSLHRELGRVSEKVDGVRQDVSRLISIIESIPEVRSEVYTQKERLTSLEDHIELFRKEASAHFLSIDNKISFLRGVVFAFGALLAFVGWVLATFKMEIVQRVVGN